MFVRRRWSLRRPVVGDIDIWEHEDLIDYDNPVQWDAENDEQLPETAWAMAPQQALKLAALITKAAEHARLFRDTP
jgi:hypothetical protein